MPRGFDVQGKPGKSSREVARVVNGVVGKHPAKAKGLKRQFSAVAGVAASLTGEQLVALAKQRASSPSPATRRW